MRKAKEECGWWLFKAPHRRWEWGGGGRGLSAVGQQALKPAANRQTQSPTPNPPIPKTKNKKIDKLIVSSQATPPPPPAPQLQHKSKKTIYLSEINNTEHILFYV